MLFTVVEARDGRLVAESADRRVKMTLEGEGASFDATTGAVIQIGPPDGPEVVVRTMYPAGITLTSASGPGAPEPPPIDNAFVEEGAEQFSAPVEVSHDLSADPLDGVPDGA